MCCRLSLSEVAGAACGQNEALAVKVRGFLVERVEFYLREAKGQAYDVVKAVLVAGAEDVRDAVARAEAVTAVRGASSGDTGDFAAVSAAFKRMKNILSQAGEKGIAAGVSVEISLLTEMHPEKRVGELRLSGIRVKGFVMRRITSMLLRSKRLLRCGRRWMRSSML